MCVASDLFLLKTSPQVKSSEKMTDSNFYFVPLPSKLTYFGYLELFAHRLRSFVARAFAQFSTTWFDKFQTESDRNACETMFLKYVDQVFFDL
jgi:hypothetical protein